MVRPPRLNPIGMAQHVIQRGNNRQACFIQDQDYALYATWLTEYAERYEVDIHAWVFMTNHVHLLATPHTSHGVSYLMQALGRRYVRYFNRKHERTGTLWEGRFKANVVQSHSYALNCQRYIELNPVRAGMVDDPAQYPWSSYQCNALGKISKLHTPHEQYLYLAQTTDERLAAYQALFGTTINRQALTEIRDALNKGLALGSDDFKSDLESQLGQRVRPAPMGRPMIIKD